MILFNSFEFFYDNKAINNFITLLSFFFSYQITIINKIEIEDTKEGIATLKKNMSNKATIELVKEIKKYYKLS